LGIAISAVTKCKYCTLFHTEAARLNGASEAEIEDAIHFAKSSAGWSAYLNGLQIDFDQFKDEIRRAVSFMRSHQRAEKELKCKDVGSDCDHVIRGNTEVEIFEKVMEHARTSHHMKEVPLDLMEKARAAIHAVAA